jgi:putative pyruvate formate lyase activating enzyme
MRASYIESYHRGLLEEKIQKSFILLEECTICPRQCRVNRLRGEVGFCRAGFLPRIASFAPHFGEERPLVGKNGSGTIFFSFCNLYCRYCQNYSISHRGEGQEVSFETLARMMIELQSIGCHNINLVTPTHYVPQILQALPLAIEMGLSIPLVYNTGGYEALTTLHLLEGIIDIYMPDFKYSDNQAAKEYSQAADYPEIARIAIKEMHRQVGDLVINNQGIAERGLLVRHLVLPQGLAGTEKVLQFLAEEISHQTYVNIMDQYYPCGDIPFSSPLSRRITREEFEKALHLARKFGLTRLDGLL